MGSEVSAPGDGDRRSGGWAVRIAVAAAALCAAALCLAAHHALTAERADLLALLAAEGGGSPPEVTEAVRRDDDPERARLAVARGLVAMELVPQLRARLASGDPAADREAARRRLAAAGDLSRRALAARPASWQAAMLLGAATYLDRSLADDPRLVREAPAWDRPLNAARELAPGNPEPGRFLVIAYLELWRVLSPAKREVAQGLLRQAFADPATFTRLIEPWLAIADRDEVFATLPEEPFAWEALGRIYTDRSDWRGYCAAHERYQEVLSARLADRLEEAAARLAGGDFQGSRVLYQEVMVRARPGRRELPLFARALADAPPGPTSEGTAAALRPWLDWTLELCLLDRCPLAPELVNRLAGMAGPLPPEVEAAADAVAGRLADAEILARRSSGRLWHEDWAPYRVAKAQLLTRRGDLGGAAEALEGVPRTWRGRAAFRAALAALAAVTAAGGAAEDDAAPKPATGTGGELWPAYAWIWHGSEATLELVAARGAEGLALTIAEAPPEGAVVEVDFDGTRLPVREAHTGAALRLPVAVEAGLHRLRFRTVAGGRVRPGPTALTSPAPPAPGSPAAPAAPGGPPPPPRTAPPA